MAESVKKPLEGKHVDPIDTVKQRIKMDKKAPNKENELLPYKDGASGLVYRVKYEKAGQIPSELSGMFTSYEDAMDAIKAYKRSK